MSSPIGCKLGWAALVGRLSGSSKSSDELFCCFATGFFEKRGTRGSRESEILPFEPVVYCSSGYSCSLYSSGEICFLGAWEGFSLPPSEGFFLGVSPLSAL